MKCLSLDKKKNAVTVEFTWQAWNREEANKTYVYDNVKVKYLDYYIN